MIYLLISIILNAYLGVAFSIFHRYQVDLFQTIVFNYWTCVITGCYVLGSFPITIQAVQEPWFLWALVMGTLFIMVFNLIALSSIKAGVTITQTANKLSFCIPVLISFLVYHEKITLIKILGIFTALAAVVLTSRKSASAGFSIRKQVPQNSEMATPALVNPSVSNPREYWLPILLFFGSGFIDSLTKFAQHRYLKDTPTQNAYLISGFMVAALLGSFVLLFQYATGKRQFKWRHVVAGIVLGFPNYFSIFYLVKALSHPGLNSSATIPINNIGILFLVSMFGIFVLKEKLSRMNYLGLALTLIAILLIYLGD